MKGGCTCGAVRFTATGVPDRVGVCHCLDCKRALGASFFAAAIYAADDVTITGQTRSHNGRHFCPECGTTVFSTSDGEIELHLGALDDPHVFTPTYELWTIRRDPWVMPIEGAAQYERDR